MNNFLPVIRSSSLFSGVSEDELTAMLSCLNAEERDFPKEDFILRAGDTVESIGLMLSGSALVYTGGHLGQSQYSFQGGAGTDIRRRVCLCLRRGAECERGRRNARYRSVFEREAHTDHVPVRLRASQPDHSQSARRAGREKSALQRKAHAHGPAHHALQN